MTAWVFIVQFVSGQRCLAQSFDGIRQMSKVVYRHTTDRRWNGTHGHVHQSGKPIGKQATKYTDRDGMYLLMTSAGKYSWMDYRFLGKRKTLALGTYPETSLAKARSRCSEARTMLADGLDPGDEKRKAKRGKLAKAAQTFEHVAGLWLEKTASSRAATTPAKVHGYLKRNSFPTIGSVPISSLKATDVLARLRKMGRAASESPLTGSSRSAARSSALLLPAECVFERSSRIGNTNFDKVVAILAIHMAVLSAISLEPRPTHKDLRVARKTHRHPAIANTCTTNFRCRFLPLQRLP